jgi:signal transduction histidine kinase
MGIRARLDNNGHVAEERTWWRAISPRRLAAFFGQADERPVASRDALTADAVIAAAVTIAAVVAVIVQARRSGGPTLIFPVKSGFTTLQLHPRRPTFPSAGLLVGTVLTTAPLAFRRIYPITAFCVMLGALIGVTGNATTITYAAVIFAAYSAVAYSAYRRLALLSVLAAAVIVTAAYPNTTPPVPGRYTALLILLPTVAVGVVIRIWRGRARESAERLRRAEAGHEAETRRAVALERARIASEMHDVVTHNVSVMVVQAGAARRVLDSSPGDAREALLAVEASGRTAMTELRNLLGLLAPPAEGEPGSAGAAAPGGGAGAAGAAGARVPVGTGDADGAGDAALAPQPGVARIPALLARVCEAGMPVELSVEAPGGSPRDLPPGVDLAAYRVVQEGLTNVMKHAGQARTKVRLEYRPRDLLIMVSDDGRPPDSGAPGPEPGPGPGPGAGSVSGRRGLIGLRERIAVYGGELDAGPRPGGGWRLTARISLDPVAGDLPVPPAYQGAAT